MLTAAFGADDLPPFVEHELDNIFAQAKAQSKPNGGRESIGGGFTSDKY